MRWLIFFIILSEVLFSLNIERNKNTILPYYLRLGSKETLINLSADYDTLTHKKSFSAKVHLYIKLYSKTIQKKSKKTSEKTSKNKKTTSFYQFKSKLGIRLKKEKPVVISKNSFKYNYKNFILYEEVRFYLPFYYKESTTIEYKRNNKIYFATKSFEKDFNGIDYSFGINFYKIFSKIVKTITFEMSGNTQNDPVIFSYKLSTSYRLSLFNKKYFYVDLNPYILSSKTYHYKIKPAIYTSINYDF